MKRRLAQLASRSDHLIAGALLTLAVQDALLLLALYAQLEPHPPASVGPFIGALLALSLRSAWGLRCPSRWTHALALVVALAHLPNFGPHKFFLPQAPLIAPMVALGLALLTQAAGLAALRLWRADAADAQPQ
jgi:hypothetical protein